MNHWLKLHWRNCIGSLHDLADRPLATLLTAAVIGIALAMPASLNLLVKNGSNLAGNWDDARDFSVYLKVDTELSQAQQLVKQIEQLAGVQQVSLTSADAALVDFRESSGLGDVLEELEGNPLPHTLGVRPTEDISVADLDALGRQLEELETVELVQIDTEWVQRLNAILDFLRRVVVLASALLVAGVLIIVGNTIRLDIQSRRDEIEVLKLVGASDGFVRRPFLYIGLWYGIFGGLVAMLVLLLGSWLLAAPLETLVGLYTSEIDLLGLDLATMGLVLAGGVLSGWGGAWTAVARHLSAIQPS